MKIIVAMAGMGSRFKNAGYNCEKYEIILNNKSLLEWSLLSYKHLFENEFVFIGRKGTNFIEFTTEICSKIGLTNFTFFTVDSLTRGQAETVYNAIKDSSCDESILVTNIDTAIEPNVFKNLVLSDKNWWLTMDADGEAWSFCKLSKEGKFITASEKKKISSYASVGLYYFPSTFEYKRIFENYVDEIIEDFKEAYIAPMFNYINKLCFDSLHISKEYVYMMGTPDDLVETSKKLLNFNIVPDVTMVVTQYNGWKYLDKLIDAFEGQKTNITKRLVIVNNGSVEQPTQELVNRIKNNNEIILINKDYGSIGHGRKVAIDNSLSRHTLITDCDDFFNDVYVDELYKTAIETNADIVYSNIYNFSLTNNTVINKQKRWMEVNVEYTPKTVPIHSGQGPHDKIYKTSILKKCEYNYETLFDDGVFVVWAISQSKKIYFNGNAEYFYRKDLQVSTSRGITDFKKYFNIFLILKTLSENTKEIKFFKRHIFVVSSNILSDERKYYKYFKINSKVKNKMSFSLLPLNDPDNWYRMFAYITKNTPIIVLLNYIWRKKNGK